jgi:hypothetical protein
MVNPIVFWFLISCFLIVVGCWLVDKSCVAYCSRWRTLYCWLGCFLTVCGSFLGLVRVLAFL